MNLDIMILVRFSSGISCGRFLASNYGLILMSHQTILELLYKSLLCIVIEAQKVLSFCFHGLKQFLDG